MDSMREKIARAAYERNREQMAPFAHEELVAWDDPVARGVRERWLANADAVLEAMRTPTEEMLDAAHDPARVAVRAFDRTGEFVSSTFSEPIWTSMIDAALTRESAFAPEG